MRGLKSKPEPQLEPASLIEFFKKDRYSLPGDITEAQLMWLIGCALLPDEFGNNGPGFMLDGSHFQTNFIDKLREDSAWDSVFRYELPQAWAQHYVAGTLPMSTNPSVEITPDFVRVRNELNWFEIDVPGGKLTDKVVDYGAGFVGLDSRLKEAEQYTGRSYLLVGSEFEYTVMNQIINLKGFNPSRIMMAGMGGDLLGSSTNLRKDNYGSASVVIASRIHGIGEATVDAAIQNAWYILRPGGVLIMRGPVREKDPRWTDMRRMMQSARKHKFGPPVFEVRGATVSGDRDGLMTVHIKPS